MNRGWHQLYCVLVASATVKGLTTRNSGTQAHTQRPQGQGSRVTSVHRPELKALGDATL